MTVSSTGCDENVPVPLHRRVEPFLKTIGLARSACRRSSVQPTSAYMTMLARARVRPAYLRRDVRDQKVTFDPTIPLVEFGRSFRSPPRGRVPLICWPHLAGAPPVGNDGNRDHRHSWEQPHMLITVRDNNVDQALRALKKKLQREGVYREMKLRRHYEKPSEKRAREHAAAVSRARKADRKRQERDR